MNDFVEVAILLAGIAIQLGITSRASFVYFVMLLRVRSRIGWRYRVGEYLMFVAYVVVVIPVGIFFPMWFAEITGGLANTQGSRAALLVIGCFGLIMSVIHGWRTSRKSDQ